MGKYYLDGWAAETYATPDAAIQKAKEWAKANGGTYTYTVLESTIKGPRIVGRARGRKWEWPRGLNRKGEMTWSEEPA